ncbi:hypothetical protein HKX48_006255 [Thoreauomyces humboldtii]|nr:hypothetical protein HKX48_006255 [Thoreauomyces humboldtii]
MPSINQHVAASHLQEEKASSSSTTNDQPAKSLQKTSLPYSWRKLASALSPTRLAIQTAQRACLAILRRTEIGHLTINLQDGTTHRFGDVNADPSLVGSVTVLKDAFWIRIALFSAMGFGEAFMYGEVDVENLAGFLTVIARNRDRFAEMQLLPVGLNGVLNSLLHSRIPNTIINAVSNIQAHYDLGNEMFASFLDPTMMYSCPIWDTTDPERDTLERAQNRKIDAMLDMASIRRGDRVLEIGTGWGALAIAAVRRFGCKVTTLTLSTEQKVLAEQRIAQAGLASDIDVQLLDYRNLDPRTSGTYDRIIAIEMLEAVGPEFLSVFFQKCDQLLHPTRGIVALQVITMPENRYDQYLKKVDFIQRHIFPGGHCPSLTALVDAAQQGSKGNLVLDGLTNIGPHYAKALRLWRESFEANCDRVAEEHGLTEKYDRVFKRRFSFYFAYCEAGFRTRTLGTCQLKFSRVGNRDLLDGIPM